MCCSCPPFDFSSVRHYLAKHTGLARCASSTLPGHLVTLYYSSPSASYGCTILFSGLCSVLMVSLQLGSIRRASLLLSLLRCCLCLQATIFWFHLRVALLCYVSCSVAFSFRFVEVEHFEVSCMWHSEIGLLTPYYVFWIGFWICSKATVPLLRLQNLLPLSFCLFYTRLPYCYVDKYYILWTDFQDTEPKQWHHPDHHQVSKYHRSTSIPLLNHLPPIPVGNRLQPSVKI